MKEVSLDLYICVCYLVFTAISKQISLHIFKTNILQLSNCDILGESVSAGNLIAVVRSAEVGDMAGSCLHVSSNSVPRIVVTSYRDRLRCVELPGKPGQVHLHAVQQLLRHL